MADEPQEKPEKRGPRGPSRDSLHDLEERLEKLRFHFEQHFMGNEKLAPIKVRDQLYREIRRFDPGGNDAVERFRHQNLTARFVTYDTYWGRILRAIEEGTYERDRFKADLREKTRRPDAQEAAPLPNHEARESAARSKAKDVGDEAAAFMASLAAGGAAIGMRGRALSAPSAPPAPVPAEPASSPPMGLRGQPMATPGVGMRGAPLVSRPTGPSQPPPAAPPSPMRGAPVAPAAPPPAARPAPSAPPAPVAPPALPMRGAPVAPAPPPMPMRGAPVGPAGPTGTGRPPAGDKP